MVSICLVVDIYTHIPLDGNVLYASCFPGCEQITTGRIRPIRSICDWSCECLLGFRGVGTPGFYDRANEPPKEAKAGYTIDFLVGGSVRQAFAS